MVWLKKHGVCLGFPEKEPILLRIRNTSAVLPTDSSGLNEISSEFPPASFDGILIALP